MLLDDMYSVLV